MIEFGSFDKFISESLDVNSQYSHREVKQVNYPVLIDSLREWLLRTCGMFEVVGFYRPEELSLWFEPETVTEVFDDLLLKFRDYCGLEKGLDAKLKYTLRRFKDNIHFLIFEGLTDEALIDHGRPSDEVDALFTSIEKSLQQEFNGHSYFVNGMELKTQEFLKELWSLDITRLIFEKHLV